MDPRFGETETAAAFKITSSLQFNFILLNQNIFENEWVNLKLAGVTFLRT